MFKNISSQKLIVFAFDSTTGLPKTGDAANITAYVSKDYGTVTVLGDTSATEMDSTNAKGYYLFDLTQAETNADTLLFSAKSTTSNIVVTGSPATVFTNPPNFSSQSIDGSGRMDVGKWLGGTIPAVNVTGVPLVDAKYLLGTIFATPMTAGIIDVNIKRVNNSTIGASGLQDLSEYQDANGFVPTDVFTSVGAIKTQTDKLTFTVSNKIDANVYDLSGSATVDGVGLTNIARALIAFLCGKCTVTDNGSTRTLSFKQQGGSVEAFNVTVAEADGARSSTGSIT